MSTSFLQGTHKLSELSCDETTDLFSLVKRTQKLVESYSGVTSSTIAIQVNMSKVYSNLICHTGTNYNLKFSIV